jgi:hypothetical protein
MRRAGEIRTTRYALYALTGTLRTSRRPAHHKRGPCLSVAREPFMDDHGGPLCYRRTRSCRLALFRTPSPVVAQPPVSRPSAATRSSRAETLRRREQQDQTAFLNSASPHLCAIQDSLCRLDICGLRGKTRARKTRCLAFAASYDVHAVPLDTASFEPSAPFLQIDASNDSLFSCSDIIQPPQLPIKQNPGDGGLFGGSP